MTAAKFLKTLLPDGSKVSLYGAGDKLELDQYGRVLAIVRIVTVYDGPSGLDTVQGQMIRKGWSVYWRKYGTAPGEFDKDFETFQKAAEADSSGIWAINPQWMKDKANERTAPGK